MKLITTGLDAVLRSIAEWYPTVESLEASIAREEERIVTLEFEAARNTVRTDIANMRRILINHHHASEEQ